MYAHTSLCMFYADLKYDAYVFFFLNQICFSFQRIRKLQYFLNANRILFAIKNKKKKIVRTVCHKLIKPFTLKTIFF